MSNTGTVFLLSNTSWYLYNFRRATLAALVEKGLRVICLSPPDEYSALLVEELGVEYVPLALDGKSVGPLRELRVLLAILQVFRQYRPDFVFNFTIKMNIYSGLVCRLLGIRYANNVSGLGTVFLHDSWLFRRVRTLYGFVNRSAARVFFQNQDDLDAFEQERLLEGASIHLLPGSGINLERFAFSDLPEASESCFIMIARLLGDKGVREYAQAAQMLKAEGVPARVLLIGPLGVSNRTAIAAEEVDAWQHAGTLEYLGSLHDVRPWIEQAHVLVLPSYREGMPRTVLEAAAMGRPAIVTDVPGCRQAIVANETGWFCKPRDARSLADQMKKIAVAPRETLALAGVKARERMEQHFSEALVVDAYLKCL